MDERKYYRVDLEDLSQGDIVRCVPRDCDGTPQDPNQDGANALITSDPVQRDGHWKTTLREQGSFGPCFRDDQGWDYYRIRPPVTRAEFEHSGV